MYIFVILPYLFCLYGVVETRRGTSLRRHVLSCWRRATARLYVGLGLSGCIYIYYVGDINPPRVTHRVVETCRGASLRRHILSVVDYRGWVCRGRIIGIK